MYNARETVRVCFEVKVSHRTMWSMFIWSVSNARSSLVRRMSEFSRFRSSGKVLKCSGCQYVYYCNRECQKIAWTNHKAECSCLRLAAGRVVPDAARVMLRIILKLNNGGDAEKSYYTEKFYRKFKDLMSREFRLFDFALTDFGILPSLYLRRIADFPDIRSDQDRLEHIEALTGVLRDLLGPNIMPNATDFLAIYGRVINCFFFPNSIWNSYSC